MTKPAPWAWLLLALLLGVAGWSTEALAQGGPPMITDDPGTPGNGKWEINVASTFRQNSHQREAEFPALDLNYGVGEHIQLKLEGSLALLKRSDRGLIGGLGDAAAGIKWRFLDEETRGLSMSVYPQVEWNLAHASARRGLVDEGTHLIFPLELSRHFGGLVIGAEIGDSISLEDGNEVFYGVVAEIPLNKTLELLVELHGVSTLDGRGSELTINCGARQKLTEQLTLLLSVGHDLHAVHGEDRSLIAYLGLQFGL